MAQIGLFDESNRFEKLSKMGDILEMSKNQSLNLYHQNFPEKVSTNSQKTENR